MSEAQQSDVIKNLVKVLICLAIVGMVIALVVYFGVVLPAQQGMVHAPMNWD